MAGDTPTPTTSLKKRGGSNPTLRLLPPFSPRKRLAGRGGHRTVHRITGGDGRLDAATARPNAFPLPRQSVLGSNCQEPFRVSIVFHCNLRAIEKEILCVESISDCRKSGYILIWPSAAPPTARATGRRVHVAVHPAPPWGMPTARGRGPDRRRDVCARLAGRPTTQEGSAAAPASACLLGTTWPKHATPATWPPPSPPATPPGPTTPPRPPHTA